MRLFVWCQYVTWNSLFSEFCLVVFPFSFSRPFPFVSVIHTRPLTYSPSLFRNGIFARSAIVWFWHAEPCGKRCSKRSPPVNTALRLWSWFLPHVSTRFASIFSDKYTTHLFPVVPDPCTSLRPLSKVAPGVNPNPTTVQITTSRCQAESSCLVPLQPHPGRCKY